DGIIMGHEGMRYSLPSRELIADAVETMARAHCFDAMICIPNCDKIVPGMLMGAARANLPTVFVSGGPMQAGIDRSGRKVDLITVFEGVGARIAGTIDDARLAELESAACPTCGSCSGMFTANSMNCLCEALGIALPGNGTFLATDPARDELFKEAGRRIVELVASNTRARDIMTPAAFENALALDVAMGGSTNTVLQTLGQNIADATVKDNDVIRPLDNPYSEKGGLAVLFGNLAPNGSVLKTGAVHPSMHKFKGPAVIFESEESAAAGILEGQVKSGDVVVIRYEGPRGGPGMQEMLAPTAN